MDAVIEVKVVGLGVEDAEKRMKMKNDDSLWQPMKSYLNVKTEPKQTCNKISAFEALR